MATLRQESVYLVTKEKTVSNVTQESLLVEVGPLINITLVETRLNTGRTKETKTSRPGDLYLCSEKHLLKHHCVN